MLGNDVVDLRDPETRPETFRPRFDARVFDASERRAIERDDDPHARRWSHWAAKEAAYKLARQVDAKFIFSPSKLVARFDAAVLREAHAYELRGTIRLPHPVGPGIADLELRGVITPEWVHMIALPAGGDWDAVVAEVAPVEEEKETSSAVRRLAALGVARDLGIDADRVAIGRVGRIPTVEIDGVRSTMGLSLSHHGGFMACAASPNSAGNEVVTAAPERAEATGRPSSNRIKAAI